MSNKNAKIEYESGATPYVMSQITDSGDRTVFTTEADLFSGLDGFAPDVRPNGILTGGDVIAAVSGTNNAVDVAALTCYLAGVLTNVAADTDVTITRPETNVARINSITVDASGDVVVIPGTAGATTSFSETRGAAGGPPFIPVDSIELAQVRVNTSANAPIAGSQIYKIVGTHREMANYPLFDIDYATGRVIFATALPASHTGSVAKAVYASYAEPIFTEQVFANDFVPAETSHSVSSSETYSGPVGSTSASLAQGSFTAILNDGITDGILSVKNQKAWFKFYQDKYKSPYILTQGIVGVSRTFNVSERPAVDVTISADRESLNRGV